MEPPPFVKEEIDEDIIIVDASGEPLQSTLTNLHPPQTPATSRNTNTQYVHGTTNGPSSSNQLLPGGAGSTIVVPNQVNGQYRSQPAVNQPVPNSPPDFIVAAYTSLYEDHQSLKTLFEKGRVAYDSVFRQLQASQKECAKYKTENLRLEKSYKTLKNSWDEYKDANEAYKVACATDRNTITSQEALLKDYASKAKKSEENARATMELYKKMSQEKSMLQARNDGMSRLIEDVQARTSREIGGLKQHLQTLKTELDQAGFQAASYRSWYKSLSETGKPPQPLPPHLEYLSTRYPPNSILVIDGVHYFTSHPSSGPLPPTATPSGPSHSPITLSGQSQIITDQRSQSHSNVPHNMARSFSHPNMPIQGGSHPVATSPTSHTARPTYVHPSVFQSHMASSFPPLNHASERPHAHGAPSPGAGYVPGPVPSTSSNSNRSVLPSTPVSANSIQQAPSHHGPSPIATGASGASDMRRMSMPTPSTSAPMSHNSHSSSFPVSVPPFSPSHIVGPSGPIGHSNQVGHGTRHAERRMSMPMPTIATLPEPTRSPNPNITVSQGPHVVQQTPPLDVRPSTVPPSRISSSNAQASVNPPSHSMPNSFHNHDTSGPSQGHVHTPITPGLSSGERRECITPHPTPAAIAQYNPYLSAEPPMTESSQSELSTNQATPPVAQGYHTPSPANGERSGLTAPTSPSDSIKRPREARDTEQLPDAKRTRVEGPLPACLPDGDVDMLEGEDVKPVVVSKSPIPRVEVDASLVETVGGEILGDAMPGPLTEGMDKMMRALHPDLYSSARNNSRIVAPETVAVEPTPADSGSPLPEAILETAHVDTPATPSSSDNPTDSGESTPLLRPLEELDLQTATSVQEPSSTIPSPPSNSVEDQSTSLPQTSVTPPTPSRAPPAIEVTAQELSKEADLPVPVIIARHLRRSSITSEKTIVTHDQDHGTDMELSSDNEDEEDRMEINRSDSSGQSSTAQIASAPGPTTSDSTEVSQEKDVHATSTEQGEQATSTTTAGSSEPPEPLVKSEQPSDTQTTAPNPSTHVPPQLLSLLRTIFRLRKEDGVVFCSLCSRRHDKQAKRSTTGTTSASTISSTNPALPPIPTFGSTPDPSILADHCRSLHNRAYNFELYGEDTAKYERAPGPSQSSASAISNNQ